MLRMVVLLPALPVMPTIGVGHSCMNSRVIELKDGKLMRDERHGGYGDRSGIKTLEPQVERGAAAVAALPGPQDIVASRCAEFQARRDAIAPKLAAMAES